MTVACVLRSGGDVLPARLRSVPMLPAVYEIVHLESGKRYVGSAQNVRKRWRGHLKSLERETTRASSHLRRAWAKHGPSAFEFRVIVICEVPELLRMEGELIRTRQAVDAGYNCRRRPSSNAGIRFGPPSEETRLKIGRANAIANLGNPSPMKGRAHTPRSRQKMSATKRARGPKIRFRGLSMCLADWADEIGITSRGLQNRLTRGWSLERALTEKSRGY